MHRKPLICIIPQAKLSCKGCNSHEELSGSGHIDGGVVTNRQGFNFPDLHVKNHMHHNLS